jgi:5'(3')-deoxyribonucleotidase
MKLGIDVDGVLADFNTAFIAYVIKVTGVDFFPARPFDIPCWNYPQYYGYSEKQVTAVWDVVKQDGRFWRTLPTYPNSRLSLNRLIDCGLRGDDVYYITNRMGVTPKCQTERWIRMLGYAYPTVLITGDKAGAARVLELDAYIDDKWENCDAVSKTVYRGIRVRTFLLDRPWNREMAPKLVTRVGSIAAMLNQL